MHEKIRYFHCVFSTVLVPRPIKLQFSKSFSPRSIVSILVERWFWNSLYSSSKISPSVSVFCQAHSLTAHGCNHPWCNVYPIHVHRHTSRQFTHFSHFAAGTFQTLNGRKANAKSFVKEFTSVQTFAILFPSRKKHPIEERKGVSESMVDRMKKFRQGGSVVVFEI